MKLLKSGGSDYSLNLLKLANVDINRKMLSEIAIHDPKGFTTIVNKAKKALEKSAA